MVDELNATTPTSERLMSDNAIQQRTKPESHKATKLRAHFLSHGRGPVGCDIYCVCDFVVVTFMSYLRQESGIPIMHCVGTPVMPHLRDVIPPLALTGTGQKDRRSHLIVSGRK